MKTFALLLCAVFLAIQVQATVIITSTWDMANQVYVLATNTITGNYTPLGSFTTNFTSVEYNLGNYAIVYTAVWNPNTMRSELVTNYVRVALGTNTTITQNGTNATLMVTNVYAAPVLTNFTVSLAQNGAVNIPFANYVWDTNGYTGYLYYAHATNGTVVNLQSSVQYTAAANFVGSDLINVSITDLTHLTNAGTISILVTNRPPLRTSVPLPVINMYRYDTLPYDLSACYTDPGGYAMRLTNIVFYAGTVTSNGLTLNITPGNWLGATNIDFNVWDGYGKTFGRVVINVLDHPPLVPNTMVTTLINVPATIPALTFCSDVDGDPLTLVAATGTNGTAIVSGTNIVFTPALNFSGVAAAGYSVSDGYITNSGIITMLVSGLSPVVTNQTVTGLERTTRVVSLLTNVSSPYGLPITLVSIVPTGCMASITGTNVQVTFSTLGTGMVAVNVTDGQNRYGNGTLTVITTNQLVVTNSTVGTGVGQPVTAPLLANTYSPGSGPGNQVTICSTSYANGVLVGSLFTPAALFTGSTVITYTACVDAGLTTASGTCTVVVTSTPPQVVSGTLTGMRDTAASYDAIVNSYSPSGLPMHPVAVSATHGTATVSGNRIVLTPTSGYLGSAVASYNVVDSAGGTTSGTATVTFTNGAPPAAANYGFNASYDSNGSGNLPYIWQANVPIPVGTSIAGMVLYRAGQQPGPLTPTMASVKFDGSLFTPATSPVGLPLRVTAVYPTNCAASTDGTNINWALWGHQFSVTAVGYQVSDGINTGNGYVVLRAGGPADIVVTNFVNALHVNGSGTITVQGYNISASGRLMVQSLTPGYGGMLVPNNVAVSGSCSANANGGAVDSHGGTIDGPANVTWPGTGCNFVVSDTRVTTIVLPAGDTGPLQLVYYGPDTGRAFVVTNNFTPLP